MQAMLRYQGLTEEKPVDFVLGTLEGRAKERTVELEVWKQEVRAELWQELQEQLATLGKMLMAEFRQQRSQAPGPPPQGREVGPAVPPAECPGPSAVAGRAMEFH
ncbi:hypothetical protein SKAU_G00284920 [Synaphobranchus kaupii]|uniref:Uncharacterized protein n=1 Tax=Synaphobranchus kaupii TaxID=118154 RepID=A0A9Q1EXU9_SYNKA|nr:hypothetical protein SKAU_G00284920 [Synaphobranchus kaupii]